MCTVTYIPSQQGNPFVLTSNRDEKAYRPTLSPEIYRHGEREIIYPRDGKAGGSWIAMDQKGKAACLLNGGFVPHKKQDFHTISRGKVLVDFTASHLNSHEYFATRNLSHVEPFTVVSMELEKGHVQNLTEFIWDGEDKYFRQLDADRPWIWSSVTLYNEEQRKMRRDWFDNFNKEAREHLTDEKIFAFHSGEHTSDVATNLVMQRDGGLKTLSITQVTLENNLLKMRYTDLLKKHYRM